ncbi:MAG TPA: hypothetical protein VFL82_08155 [Thermomicrobiales bacterium]|nr:hypothetical protein [Thermomicrobiales bacterium]
MSPLLGRGKLKTDTTAAGPVIPDGWRFTLKGSPRHYDDVLRIIQAGGATVYFGEALAYERGAGIALWRISAQSFEWLPRLYAWWAEQERLEPIQFTFHLYLPSDLKYPALDLREHPPAQVEAFIKERAPQGAAGMGKGAPATPPAGDMRR